MDARWLAHRYDPQHDAVHFRYVPLAERARATFLTDEYLGVELAPQVIARAGVARSAMPAAPLRFIFHSAFCLSTLLGRAFEMPGRAMALKEPAIFNDLVGWRHRGADGAKLTAVLSDALSLCARPCAPGETVVIKPSNVANGLCEGILRLSPDARALMLHAPLDEYLHSVAKKQVDGRLWVRDLLVKQLRDGLVLPVFADEDLLKLTDLQVAAVGWLSQHALFQRLAVQFPHRVRTLDSSIVARDAAAAMRALFAFFEIALSGEELDALITGPTFTQHSKHGTAFDFAARKAEYDMAAVAHQDELTKVAAWARVIAQTAGVPMELSNRLI